YDVRFKAVVADDLDELSTVIRAALEWADLLVTTGGLGPTADDLTRDAVARVLAVPLEVDEQIVDRIRERFARRGMTMPDINRRQGMVPRGAVVLPNPMFDDIVRARLAPAAGTAGVFRRTLKITGRTESDVDAAVQPIYSRWRSQPIPIATTILAVLGQIELHLAAQSKDRAAANDALDAAVAELKEAL